MLQQIRVNITIFAQGKNIRFKKLKDYKESVKLEKQCDMILATNAKNNKNGVIGKGLIALVLACLLILSSTRFGRYDIKTLRRSTECNDHVIQYPKHDSKLRLQKKIEMYESNGQKHEMYQHTLNKLFG